MKSFIRSGAVAASLAACLIGLSGGAQAQSYTGSGFSASSSNLGAPTSLTSSWVSWAPTSFSSVAGSGGGGGANSSSIFDLTVDALPGQFLTSASLTLSGTYELPAGALTPGEGVFVRGQYFGGGLVGSYGASPLSFASGVWSYTTPLVALAGGTTSITFSTGLFAALAQTPGLARISLSNASLNVSAVPEPETYALMLSGLVAVFFMASRRRNEG